MFGSGLEEIGEDAFEECSALKQVTIPSNVKTVGRAAFYSCLNLESVTIEEGLTQINNSTFQQCFNLQSVSIPSSVTSIGSNAFYACGSLSDVTCYATVPPVAGKSAFVTIKRPATLRVPAASIDLYRNADEWKYFNNFVALESSAVNSVQNDKTPSQRKMLKDGKLQIFTKDATFNAQGIRCINK